MNAVLADQERDPETVLRREVHRPADLRAEDVQQRPGLTRVDERQVLAAGVEHQQLADLLLERHAGDEVGHALVDGESGIPVRGRSGGRLCRHRGRGRHERERRESDPDGSQEADGRSAWHIDLIVRRILRRRRPPLASGWRALLRTPIGARWNDGAARARTYREYEGLGHGFGLGTGTSAEGWAFDAIRFWETSLGKDASKPGR